MEDNEVLSSHLDEKPKLIHNWQRLLVINSIVLILSTGYFIFREKLIIYLFNENHLIFKIIYLDALVLISLLGCITNLLIFYLQYREYVRPKTITTTQTESITVISGEGNVKTDHSNTSPQVTTQVVVIEKITTGDILVDCLKSKERLEKEIYNLYSRGNINLIIGSITTLLGVIILFISALNANTLDNIDKILSFFIPRISTVLFIEVFSFFFLRLYRNSLIDIKYYHNELTNVDFKIISLKTALLKDLEPLNVVVVKELLKTERNGIIKSDESTLVSMMSKLENDRDKTFADSFKTITDGLSKLINDKGEKAK